MRKWLTVAFVAFAGLSLAACHVNADGSLGVSADQTSSAAKTSTQKAGTAKLSVPAQVRVAHNRWATVAGTTDAKVKVTIGLGADVLHTTQSDADGHFSLQYKLPEDAKRRRVRVSAYDQNGGVTSKTVLLVVK